MFIFVLLASHGFEPRVRHIYISFIHLRQVCGIFKQVWGMCEECWSLFYSHRTVLRDIHTGLRHLWTMLINVLFASPGSQPSGTIINIFFMHLRQVWGIFIRVWGVVRNIHIYFIHWEQVWGIFSQLWGGYGECLYLFCLPHMGLSCVWGPFISPLFTWDRSEGHSNRYATFVRNVDLCFIHLGQVWGTCEQCW